jgi:hypothetical protein
MTNSFFSILIALNLWSQHKKTEEIPLNVIPQQPVIKCDSIQSVNNKISICIISPFWASTSTNLTISSTAKVKELKKNILIQWRLTDANLYYNGQIMNPKKNISYYGIPKSGSAIQIYYSAEDIISE